ncbi:MAG: hypothetical protein WCH57_08760 [Verrucomicrobiota bacterium]
MAEWRDTHPDAKAAAEAYPIPHAFLAGNRIIEAGAQSKNSRASLEAYDEQTEGRASSAASIEGFRAAIKPLIKESRRALHTGRKRHWQPVETSDKNLSGRMRK